MSKEDIFTNITQEYDNKLFIVFKNIIDEAVKESLDKKLSSIEKYVYICKKIDMAYYDLAIVLGIKSPLDRDKKVIPPISEKLLERIYNYLNPIFDEVKNYIRNLGIEVKKAENIGELIEKYQELSNILSLDVIYEDTLLFNNVEFGDINHTK